MIDIQNKLTYIRQLTNLSLEELSNIFNIPLVELSDWQEKPDTFPSYIFYMLMSALCNEGYIKEPPIIVCDPRYMYPEGDEASASIIDIKEWKTQYPNYIALVKLLDCGTHALLLERCDITRRSRLESHKNVQYEDDATVVII
ncbi:hypothetical protein [Pseudobutyrivibrio sp. LB2011]|uniref:hypothetical protein n=1 Tax=Pseudobutyrivibrio sp. LB2011 TaxID=1408312 RepID=UPI0005D255CD|nr:hypothetical protein [Pseudobutyrivibrio sp. LB2011]